MQDELDISAFLKSIDSRCHKSTKRSFINRPNCEKGAETEKLYE